MPYGKYVLITFGLFGRSGHIPLVPGDDEVAVFFANNSAVEGTTHAMNTTEILETVLQRSAAVAQTGPVEWHQGRWLKAMLPPCCHRRNTFP